jgi:hypothetical protein
MARPYDYVKAAAGAEDRSVCSLIRAMIREGLDRRAQAKSEV